MNNKSNEPTTESRDLRTQSKGGARGTSGLRVEKNPKATGASGSSLKSQGETMTRTTGNNMVIHFIVTYIVSMKLRSILFFTETINETITYFTCTLSIFKTIKTEIGLCSIGPDTTLLIVYVPTIFYPKVVKRLLTTNVPKLKSRNCFLLHSTEPKCCQSLHTKPVMESKTTCTSLVYLYTIRTNSIIKLYKCSIMLVTKLFYIINYVGLSENIVFCKTCINPKLEVDETMFPRLAEQNGLIMIGPNALEIVGGGIEKAIEELEKKKTEPAEEMETAGDDSVLNYSA